MEVYSTPLFVINSPRFWLKGDVKFRGLKNMYKPVIVIYRVINKISIEASKGIGMWRELKIYEKCDTSLSKSIHFL